MLQDLSLLFKFPMSTGKNLLKFVEILATCPRRKFRLYWCSKSGQWRTQDSFPGEGGLTNSVEDRGQRGRGSGGGSPLVRGSGGSCNLVQGISFHIVKFS